MRHYVHLFALLMTLFLGFGGFILYQAITEPSHDQITSLVGGAFLLSLGLLCLVFEAKSLVRWIQDCRMDETADK